MINLYHTQKQPLIQKSRSEQLHVGEKETACTEQLLHRNLPGDRVVVHCTTHDYLQNSLYATASLITEKLFTAPPTTKLFPYEAPAAHLSARSHRQQKTLLPSREQRRRLTTSPSWQRTLPTCLLLLLLRSLGNRPPWRNFSLRSSRCLPSPRRHSRPPRHLSK